MDQRYQNIPSIYLVIFFLLFNSVPNVHLTQKVPAMLWFKNNDIQSEPLIPDSFQTLMDDIYPEDLLNFEQSKQIPKIVFVQNDLSVEQFSRANLPLISKLFDENNGILFPNSEYQPSVYEKFETYIPLKGETLEENEPIIKYHMESFNQTGPVMFVLTGKNNDLYDSMEEKSRIRREADLKSKVLQFPNKDPPCIYAYIKKINVIQEDEPSKKQIYGFDDIAVTDGQCNDLNKNRADYIEFSMNNKTAKKTMKMKIAFEFPKSGMWKISAIDLEEKKWYNNNLTTSSEMGFSYSCSKLCYKLYVNGDIANKSVKVELRRFQIQPYVIKTSTNMFEESFDCAVWFTIPILSSVLVCLLLILILYCGIRALMSISTPDRFENPKSKGLIITGVEE